MSTVQISWFDPEQTIICTEYSGAWTWDDFHTTLEAAIAMMQSVDYRVDLIVAPHRNAVMPKGSFEPHFKRAIQLMPPNFGIQAIVSHSILSRTVASIFLKISKNSAFHNRLFFVTNMDEAHQLILKERQRSAAPTHA
ncbi:MAG: hypothetical protein IT321_18955 [Anaerolineae bacterium]|nr:hypothetical protein [Anaerolineae bacterium]